jgi:hypothetical protein
MPSLAATLQKISSDQYRDAAKAESNLSKYS